MISPSSILERIEQLTQQRDELVRQANLEVAAYNAGIGELRRLLSPPTEPALDAPISEKPTSEEANDPDTQSSESAAR